MGMARDLLALVATFKPGMADWIGFVLLQQDTWVKTRKIRFAILKMELETLLGCRVNKEY